MSAYKYLKSTKNWSPENNA